MSEECYYLDDAAEDKQIKIAGALEKAASSIHAAYAANEKVKKAKDILPSNDKFQLWCVLQEYLLEYRHFINTTVAFTGIKVFDVDFDYYNSLSVEQIKNQIKICIGFVYGKQAIRLVGETALKQCFKKICKNDKILTEKELESI